MSGEVDIGLVAIDFDSSSSASAAKSPMTNPSSSSHVTGLLQHNNSAPVSSSGALWDAKKTPAIGNSAPTLPVASPVTVPLQGSSSSSIPLAAVASPVSGGVSSPPVQPLSSQHQHQQQQPPLQQQQQPSQQQPQHNIPLPQPEGVKRASTVGPFGSPTLYRNYQQSGLIHFQPQDLHREFPHLARGSYGVLPFSFCSFLSFSPSPSLSFPLSLSLSLPRFSFPFSFDLSFSLLSSLFIFLCRYRSFVLFF